MKKVAADEEAVKANAAAEEAGIVEKEADAEAKERALLEAREIYRKVDGDLKKQKITQKRKIKKISSSIFVLTSSNFWFNVKNKMWCLPFS